MSHIKSFGDLGDKSDDGSDSDDGRGGMNEFYAGGAKSGQVVRGAPKEKDEDNVASLFDKARRAGAVQGTADDLKQTQPASTFQGTGRTLAGGSSQPAQGQQQQQGPLLYVITFYRNNIFTVNDGPARSTLDPANRAFIEAIGKGECPEELEPDVPGTPITVNLVRNESDYQAPEKPKAAAFQGTGRTLTSGSAGASSSAPAAAAAAAAQGEWEGVNSGLPTTSLQLRLADGSRMVASFNHTHRISDIRRFIRAARPELTFGYSLMTGVPPQPIEESPDKTLEQAGLLNSVVIQKK